jgi:hypothetical protein
MPRHKAKGEREPRTPMLSPDLPASFEQALEAQVIKTMSGWPDRMVNALRAIGLGDFSEAGNRVLQAFLEHKLAISSDDPDFADNLSSVVYIAEQGHVAAQRALERYGTALLEDPKADLPTSVRSYLIRLWKGLIPTHPQDQSDVIKNLIRDAGIVTMVDVGKARWPLLPKLNGNGRLHSLAYFVGEVMTRRGIELSERQIRKIYQNHATRAQRMTKFLIGEQTF